MPETLTKTVKSQDAERAQEKKRQLDPAPLPVKALVDESVPFTGLLGVSAMEPPMESHAALLGDPRFSRSANNAQRARTVTELQATYGNQYVQRLVESFDVQRKPTVGSPDDQYEKEADRVADAVTRASTPNIQRKAEPEELGKREATIRYAHNFETVWHNAHSLPRAKHGILEHICLEHEKWEREFGYDYRLLIHLLIKKGYKISTPKGSSERKETELSSQETVLTSISDRKNRRRLWRVPFWEVMPKLRRLVTKKYGFEAYNPRAVLDRVLRSHQFFVSLGNLGQIKWVQLLKWYRRGLFTDCWLLPKTKQKAYALHPGPKTALDFREWLPKMLLDTWRYKEPDARLAIELGKLDKDLKDHKKWVATEAKHSTYFGMEYLRDFHMIRALNDRSLLKLGGWAHEFYGTKWYSPGRWAKSSYKRRLPR
jgi:hypothetical protein